MRIRSIKPEFWKSDDIAALDWHDRLLFIGLWSYVDDNGVGRDSEKLITAELFPLEDDPRDTLARMHRGLARLHERGLIDRYEVDGKRFLYVKTWESHQKIDRPAKPRYPLPTTGLTRGDADSDNTRETVASVSRALDASSMLDQGSGIRDQGIKGAGCGTHSDPDAAPMSTPPASTPPKEGAVAKPVKTRGTRLADDFIPSESSRKAIVADFPQLDIRMEHAKFVDHWIAQPGQKGVKLDWDATWRNWMRRAGGDLAKRSNVVNLRQQQTDDLFARAMARAEAAGAAAVEGRVIL